MSAPKFIPPDPISEDLLAWADRIRERLRGRAARDPRYVRQGAAVKLTAYYIWVRLRVC